MVLVLQISCQKHQMAMLIICIIVKNCKMFNVDGGEVVFSI